VRDLDQTSHRLWAARLIGAGAVAILAQFAVDMPDGYFGRSDRITLVGAAFTAVVFLLAVAGALGALGRRRWTALVTPVLLSLSLGAFVAPLVDDPVISGAVVIWQLVLLGRFFFAADTVRAPRERDAERSDETGAWLARNGPAARHLLCVSLLATTAVVGYRLGHRVPALVVCLVLAGLAIGLTVRFVGHLWRGGSRAPFVLLALLVAAAASAAHPAATLWILAGYQALLLVLLLVKEPVFEELIDHFYRRPALLVLVSFVLLIALGTLLLSFPAMAAGGKAISPLNALFTATSASCVTGLIVLDTPRDFSLAGQIVILLLIQAGGLNIMVLSTFAALLLGRRLAFRGEGALGEVLDLPRASSATRLTVFIVISTLLVEAAGSGVLAYGYLRHGQSAAEALWNGIFHAVSAFCNAGFALQSDSLIPFQRDPLVLVVMAVLIVLGGLGFAVLAAGWARLRGRGGRRLAAQVRIVLAASAVLIVAGTVGYATLEWNRSLAGLDAPEKLLNALFQSVTLRTAGFNSVDLGALQPATLLMMMAFMFVGASPGGTGGGIKTTTLVVLLSSIPAIIRGEARVVLFGRTLPLEIVYRSAAIAVMAALVVFGGAALLLASQPQPFQSLVFETFSAVGTVGLSLGATPRLDTLGKIVVIVVMLVGRIGPLTLALLLGRKALSRLRYPEAGVMVG